MEKEEKEFVAIAPRLVGNHILKESIGNQA